MQKIQETWVQSLGWEGPLEKEMATCFSILTWKIPWTEEPDRLQSLGSQRVRHDWECIYIHTHTHTQIVMQHRRKGTLPDCEPVTCFITVSPEEIMLELKHTGVRGKEGEESKLIVIPVCAYIWSYPEAHDLGYIEKAFSGLQFGCEDRWWSNQTEY